MEFFVGLHHPNKAFWVDRAFISANALRDRVGGFMCNEWVMDSGAFTEISTHGRYRSTVAEYAAIIRRFAGNGELRAAVAQDYMCEPFILEKTGLTVADHQRLTIERYDALMAEDVAGVYIMPVLQGFAPAEYVAHLEAYGARLAPGAWVGVGSVCKRQGAPDKVAEVLEAIHAVRPDLRLHGFGVKLTALKSARVREHLHTSDSMAWSLHARKHGMDQNDTWIARHYELQVLKAIDGELGPWAQAFGEMLAWQEIRKRTGLVAQAETPRQLCLAI